MFHRITSLLYRFNPSGDADVYVFDAQQSYFLLILTWMPCATNTEYTSCRIEIHNM